MQPVDAYQKTNITQKWTRVDLLVMLYDRALAAVESCEIALTSEDQDLFLKHEITFRKTIVAIQSGLKTDECEIAFNIARLLEFVLFTFDNKRFDPCKTILAQIRDSFVQIADQANELERQGEIEPIPDSDAFESIA